MSIFDIQSSALLMDYTMTMAAVGLPLAAQKLMFWGNCKDQSHHHTRRRWQTPSLRCMYFHTVYMVNKLYWVVKASLDMFTATILAELQWGFLLVQEDWVIVVYPPGGGFFLNISTLPVSPAMAHGIVCKEKEEEKDSSMVWYLEENKSRKHLTIKCSLSLSNNP